MLDSFNQLSYFQFSFFLTLSNFYSESRTPSPDRSGYPTVKPRSEAERQSGRARSNSGEQVPGYKKIRPENSERIVYLETFETL